MLPLRDFPGQARRSGPGPPAPAAAADWHRGDQRYVAAQSSAGPAASAAGPSFRAVPERGR